VGGWEVVAVVVVEDVGGLEVVEVVVVEEVVVEEVGGLEVVAVELVAAGVLLVVVVVVALPQPTISKDKTKRVARGTRNFFTYTSLITLYINNFHKKPSSVHTLGYLNL
jgi:hypothetical protein